MKTHDPDWPNSGLFRSQVFCLISVSILLYDHSCTIDKEVNLIWKKGIKSLSTVLFVANRYLPYIYVFSALEQYWTISPSQEACRQRDIWNDVLIAISLATSEFILALRTWAIWNQCRRVLVTLIVAALIKVPFLILVLYNLLKRIQYMDLSTGGTICIRTKPLIWETLSFVIIVVMETLIAGLTMVKAVEAKGSSSEWYFKIHYMGIIYYVYNLMVAIFNVVGTLLFDNMSITSFSVLQGVFQSVLCSRVIFLAREPSEVGMVFSASFLPTNQYVFEALSGYATKIDHFAWNQLSIVDP
ncbi:hypothetical protein AGABI2DRAFT_117408 [Agaricus bisporus var. bisporus H97]|uniref:hypothetical protein n=1 Tax=Agaricus bisporus var. bisporus (strain H97 / ATCC MYA-4626 / FGSC 10389) TaxID=936046 RepID=UPI00029F5C30|nr:hypothetical protein AGABI2DRAFT_117408 [Agaricus bisporus var. bisporus H97]EKV48599.1 hypothetical protein AGABI2DRAFT_117408 [Agaricus bisporus var. bisporus H97]